MNIAKFMIKLFNQVGIKRIWGVTGDSLNGLVDGLRADGNIEWIGVRHEEVAAFAAGAEAEISGELAVCAGSCGPGNMHLINGLYNCYRNQTPVLAIAADIPSTESGLNYFQETDPKKLFSDCSVYCEKISNRKQMPQVIEIAIRQAILHQSVSVIILPGDIALEELPKELTVKWQKPLLPRLEPNIEAIHAAAKKINQAENITLFCGAGCQGAHDQVVELAAKLKAPIVHALRGKEFIEYDNPYSVGMTGLIGFDSGYQAMENSDLILLIGTSFPYRHFYPKGKVIIQIDKNAKAIGRHVQIDLGIVSDALPAIKALCEEIQPKTKDKFLQRCLIHYQNTRTNFDKLAVITPKSQLIHPQTLAKLLSKKANDDAIFTCDVGTPTLWSARYIEMSEQRRLIGSFNHGSMANALSMAIGAQCVDKKRQVIAFCGDGGFSMLMGDLLTLVPYQLPVKVVVLNNSSLGFVDMEMKASGYVSNTTELKNSSFADIASASGVKSLKVARPEELSQAIDELLAVEGPALLEVITSSNELSMPPNLQAEHIKGFGLYALKAVLNGHGDELINIAKINLFR